MDLMLIIIHLSPPLRGWVRLGGGMAAASVSAAIAATPRIAHGLSRHADGLKLLR